MLLWRLSVPVGSHQRSSSGGINVCIALLAHTMLLVLAICTESSEIHIGAFAVFSCLAWLSFLL